MQNKLPMKDLVTGLLKDQVPQTYYYHDHLHTLYVLDKALEMGRYENCTEKEMELLTIAALWHDTGYINIYTGHEEEGCRLARQYLPGYGLSEDDINAVCGMIMATKIPQSPKNKLEAIIADADLEYLGTEDAARQADLLFRELQSLDPELTKERWDQMQISFMEDHHYFTDFCKKHRAPMKSVYLSKLKENM